MKILLFVIFIICCPSLMISGEELVLLGHGKKGIAVGAVRFVDGRALISTRISGDDFQVSVRTSEASAIPFKEGFRWGGEGSMAPSHLITSVSVVKGKEKIFVPISSYSDLGDPHEIYLNPTSSGFDLTIIGGDAGVAYRAILVFEQEWLVRRRVVHGEFPDQAWEETKYAYNNIDS